MADTLPTELLELGGIEAFEDVGSIPYYFPPQHLGTSLIQFMDKSLYKVPIVLHVHGG